MKKRRTGLRDRECLLIAYTLLLPWWLLVCEFTDPQRFSGRVLAGGIGWALLAVGLAGWAESQLEARGRYVDSGWDISWKDIGSWCDRNAYMFNLGSALFGCLVMACFPADPDIANWRRMLLPGITALNIICAIRGKPSKEGADA